MAEGGRMLHFARGRGQCGITITQVNRIHILKHIVNITITQVATIVIILVHLMTIPKNAVLEEKMGITLCVCVSHAV